MKPKISVVIPIFNEESNIEPLYKRLTQTLRKLTNSYEIIFINDGSTDNSSLKIKKLRRYDKKIKYINFSRNFGHMPAINAGLSHTTGKKVVIMDADLQDPPEIIERLYKKSQEGFDIVYGVKKKR